jgi:hypothetical protein
LAPHDRPLYLFAAEVRHQGTGDYPLVQTPAIDALVDSFHYRLSLVVVQGGEFSERSLRHDGHFSIPTPAQITLFDALFIGLDVPGDLLPLRDMNHELFSLVEDQLSMELRVKCAPHWAKIATSLEIGPGIYSSSDGPY